MILDNCKEENNRPDFDEYFISIANVVKTRSTCQRRSVGCVLTKDNRIIATGYNGAPSKVSHCSTCLRNNVESGTRHELCMALHAEQNAITQAARFGISTDSSVMYITHKPCIICAKLIISSGIRKVVFENDYPDKLSDKILSDAGIEIVKFNTKVTSV